MRLIIKRATAPLSIILCVMIISVAYYQYKGIAYQPPIVLNSQFKYFTFDPITNGSKPYLWEVAVIRGPDDFVFVNNDHIKGKSCVGLHVYQDGVNDTNNWVSIHVKQDITGNACQRLFSSNIGIMLYSNFSYVYFHENNDPRNAFGVEINDGTRILWFLFSDKNDGVYQLKNHRIVVIKTPLKEWVYKEINISKEFEAAGWNEPKSVSFILLLGSTKLKPGYYDGYFNEIIIKESNNEGKNIFE
jgi:hypothetical protein